MFCLTVFLWQSMHMLLHLLRHGGDLSGRTRNELLRCEAGGWVVLFRISSGKPCMCSRKCSRDISSHIFGMRLSSILRQTGCYGRPEVGCLFLNLFCPYVGKCFRVCRVFGGQSVYLRVPVTIIIGVRTDEPVNLFFDYAVFYNDNPHAAYAGKFPVCRFKIYCNEIRHDFATPLNKKIR